MDAQPGQAGRLGIEQPATSRRNLFKMLLALIAASYAPAIVANRLDSQGWILGPGDR